jgi:hypothetical protein
MDTVASMVTKNAEAHAVLIFGGGRQRDGLIAASADFVSTIYYDKTDSI